MTTKKSSQVSFFAGEGRWFRFSEYRVVEDEKVVEKVGMSIAPAKGAQLEFYSVAASTSMCLLPSRWSYPI